jgi:hypothetical protein
LNSNLKKKGFNNLDDDMLKDTANIFSEEVTNTQKLFVYYFTRNCAGLQAFTIGNCLQISEEEFAGCPDPNATTCEKLTFSLRDYIYPGTRRGPDSTQTLPPRVLKLHKVITTSTRKMYLPMTLK